MEKLADGEKWRCRGRSFLLLGRCWEGLVPTRGDGGEEGG